MRFATLASLALLVASAQACVWFTSPIQSTQCTGGQTCQATWTDDCGASGVTTVEAYLYVNGDKVQDLGSVDVSTTSSLSFMINPSVGADGPYYLVFVSADQQYTVFSASFNVDGMTGTTPTGSSSAAPAPTNATATGSSASAGTSSGTASTTGTETGSASASASGTSSPVSGTTTTPTGSTSAPGTTTAPSSSLTTPTVSGTSTLPSSSTIITRTATATASPTTSNAAGRIGTSTSFGGIAALFALAGALVF